MPIIPDKTWNARMIRRTALTTFSATTATLLAAAALPHEVRAEAVPEQHALSDAQYRTRTLTVGTLSKLTSQLAQKKAQNFLVKRFADFEVAEQTTVAQDLTDRANPPPAKLAPAEQKILARLKALSGTAFERDYVQVQIAGHQELRQIQEGYLRSGHTRDLVHIARLVDTFVHEHLALLRELEKVVHA